MRTCHAMIKLRFIYFPHNHVSLALRLKEVIFSTYFEGRLIQVK